MTNKKRLGSDLMDTLSFVIEMVSQDLEAIGASSINTIGRDMLKPHRERDDVGWPSGRALAVKHPAIQASFKLGAKMEREGNHSKILRRRYKRAASKLGEAHPYTQARKAEYTTYKSDEEKDKRRRSNRRLGWKLGKRTGAYIVKNEGGSSAPGSAPLSNPYNGDLGAGYAVYHDIKNQRRMKATSQLIQRADGWRKEVDPEATKAAGGKIRTKWVHHPEKELDDNTYAEHHTKNMERAGAARTRRRNRVHRS